ncbi:hypothetical protein ENBRE01_3048 [Enteropsectra breve]|nr:hypothetical protein ENBRE01_3048 [Enteropsectra breve]
MSKNSDSVQPEWESFNEKEEKKSLAEEKGPTKRHDPDSADSLFPQDVDAAVSIFSNENIFQCAKKQKTDSQNSSLFEPEKCYNTSKNKNESPQKARAYDYDSFMELIKNEESSEINSLIKRPKTSKEETNIYIPNTSDINSTNKMASSSNEILNLPEIELPKNDTKSPDSENVESHSIMEIIRHEIGDKDDKLEEVDENTHKFHSLKGDHPNIMPENTFINSSKHKADINNLDNNRSNMSVTNNTSGSRNNSRIERSSKVSFISSDDFAKEKSAVCDTQHERTIEKANTSLDTDKSALIQKNGIKVSEISQSCIKRSPVVQTSKYMCGTIPVDQTFEQVEYLENRLRIMRSQMDNMQNELKSKDENIFLLEQQLRHAELPVASLDEEYIETKVKAALQLIQKIKQEKDISTVLERQIEKLRLENMGLKKLVLELGQRVELLQKDGAEDAVLSQE